MWPWSFLRNKALPPCSLVLVVALLLIQMGVWYPFLQSQSEQTTQLERKQAAQQKAERLSQEHSHWLMRADFLEGTPFHSHAIEKRRQQIRRWVLHGDALLSEWQAMEETVQEHVSLGLLSASWQALDNGRWRGRLVFAVIKPKRNPTYQDWLPIRFQSHKLQSLDWRLISTLTVKGETAALLSNHAEKHWVSQGDWLPTLGLSVVRVAAKKVTLMSASGQLLALNLHLKQPAKE